MSPRKPRSGANGSGSVYRHGKRWCAEYFTGYDADGAACWSPARLWPLVHLRRPRSLAAQLEQWVHRPTAAN